MSGPFQTSTLQHEEVIKLLCKLINLFTFFTAYCFLSWYIVNTNPFPPLPILEFTAFPVGSGYFNPLLNLLSRYECDT